MNIKNLKEVFEECESENIYVNLDDTYCITIKQKKPNRYRKDNYIGQIYAPNFQNLERIMEDLYEEGSADVSWCFEGDDLSKIGTTLNKIFYKNGYIVEWENGDDTKISTVIEKENLPPELLKKWNEYIIDNYNSENEENSDLEQTDISEISYTSKNENDDSEEESEDNFLNIEDIENSNISSNENDDSEDETMCVYGCECVNCEEEREEAKIY